MELPQEWARKQRGAGSSGASSVRGGWNFPLMGGNRVFLLPLRILRSWLEQTSCPQSCRGAIGAVQSMQGNVHTTKPAHQDAGWGPCFPMCHLFLGCNWSFPTLFPKEMHCNQSWTQILKFFLNSILFELCDLQWKLGKFREENSLSFPSPCWMDALSLFQIVQLYFC